MFLLRQHLDFTDTTAPIGRCVHALGAVRKQRLHTRPDAAAIVHQRAVFCSVSATEIRSRATAHRHITDCSALTCSPLRGAASILIAGSGAMVTFRDGPNRISMTCPRCAKVQATRWTGADTQNGNTASRPEYCPACRSNIRPDDSTGALLWLLGRLATCGLSAGMPAILIPRSRSWRTEAASSS